MHYIAKIAGEVIDALLVTDSRRATKYLSPHEVVSATRVTFGGKIDKRDRRMTIVLKIGEPNFAERRFIKGYVKAFPFKRIHIRPFSRSSKRRVA